MTKKQNLFWGSMAMIITPTVLFLLVTIFDSSLDNKREILNNRDEIRLFRHQMDSTFTVRTKLYKEIIDSLKAAEEKQTEKLLKK